MSIKIDLHLLEVLSSKICHDLISPIGAVNNGIEFLQEMGADAGDEVTGLLSFSASQASSKLQAYRIAYGAGGADDTIKPEEAHAAIEAIVGAEDKINQDWDPHGELGYDERPKAFSKVLICALLLGMECLPKGGTLKVEAGSAAGQTVVIAENADATIRGMTALALTGDLPEDMLDPKYVHAVMTGIIGRHYGFQMGMQDAGGAVKISIKHG